MEKAQAGTVHSSEASSSTSCVTIEIDLSKETLDTDNELSKEKEEELLFGTEEEGEGDDEDALSDDSLRLRLSDDDDLEQEVNITNPTSISEFKLQSRKTECVDVITEKKSCSDIQQIVKEAGKPDNGKLEQKQNLAIKASKNSALASDENTSKNKKIQDNICNLKNSSKVVSESNEKCISKSDKDLKITVAKTECSNATSEQHLTLENDNLSTNNHIEITNLPNTELIIDSHNLKETVDNYKEMNATNTCELNKLDKVDSKIIDSTKVQITNKEKDERLPTLAVVSNSNDDNSHDKVIDEVLDDNHHSVKCSIVEINNSQNSMDSIKSSDDLSYKDVEHKNKHKNIEHENKNASTIQSVEKEKTILLIQNQNSLLNVQDSKEAMNEDHDIKSDTQIVNNNSMSKLQRILESKVENSNKNMNADVTTSRKKRSKKTFDIIEDNAKDKQEEIYSGRQKRKTARNAEEIIRKKYLNSDSDSSDSTEQFVVVNHKLNQDIRPASPPSLKRNCSDNEIFNGIKKAKMSPKFEKKNIAKLTFVEKFFQRDVKEKLPKLTQEELEELLIQKIAETITMRSEIGQLREQARISEKYQEVMRTKLQQLTKQVKDFEMVVNRNAIDRRTNPDKTVAPIKINRSVGLQVNFITEHGIQSLRQVQQTSHVKSAPNVSNASSSASVPNTPTTVSSSTAESNNNTRRNGIKTRSPRPVTTTPTPINAQSTIQTTPTHIPTVTPAALVVAKPIDSSHTLTLSNQSTNLQPILSSSQQQIQPQSQQTIVLNGKIQNQVNRPTVITSKTKNSDLIDLTDEEEKNKSANVKITAITTAPILEQQLNAPKYTQSFQRVIQTLPTNVAITTQPTSIKVITPNQPPTNAIVNSPRLAYVMQSNAPRQVLITSTANQQVQIRPVTCRAPFSAVAYKTGMPTIANGTNVRVLTAPVLQISKHPAPLPDTPSYTTTAGNNWKLPPPAPSLKISKVSNGIVLSWNMNLSDKYADIASYQLYAYQEVAGVNPSTSLWKKVGDVRALPLPMACTLTQFSEGNNYYFAVRAVDTHSRKGQYSIPGNISL